MYATYFDPPQLQNPDIFYFVITKVTQAINKWCQQQITQKHPFSTHIGRYVVSKYVQQHNVVINVDCSIMTHQIIL